MRKAATGILIIIFTAAFFLSAHAGTLSVSGYEPADAGQVWSESVFFRRMEEMSGVSLTFEEYTDKTQWDQAVTEMAQGAKQLPDVLFKASLTQSQTEALYQAGRIIDLAPLLEEYAPNLSALLASHPEWRAAITQPDGTILTLPCINPLRTVNGIWINRTWLDALGLPMPTDVQSFTDMLIAFRDLDPNGNSRKDEIPLEYTGLYDLKYLGHMFGLAANDYNVYTDENGSIATALTTDANREFTEWLHMLWNERLMDRNGFTASDTSRAATDSSSQIRYGVIIAPTVLSTVSADAALQYELMMPLSCNGKTVYRDTAGDVIPGTFAITAACTDPAEALRWIDMLYSEEGSALCQAGLEGSEYVRYEDGTWNWIATSSDVLSVIVPKYTIVNGAPAPCYISPAFQLAFDDGKTRQVLSQISELKQRASLPVPQTVIPSADMAEIDALQQAVGYTADLGMVHFITGDEPLNDATWNHYLNQLHIAGLDELSELWQRQVQHN